MPPGRYQYEYSACGMKVTNKVILPLGKVLRIQPCKTTKIIVKNFTLKEAPGTALILRLSGPVKYYFVITQPQEKFIVQQGVYEFTLNGCKTIIDSDTIMFNTSQYRWAIHCPP